MQRPFKDKRVLGPFIEYNQGVTEDPDKYTELDFDDGGKEVIGVPGTPMPNKDKEPLIVLYVLSGTSDHVYYTDDFTDQIDRDINQRDIFESDVRVKFLKSGKSSSKNFKEQAVFVKIPGDELAITESQLQRIEGIINRSPGQTDVEVKERIYEMRGN